MTHFNTDAVLNVLLCLRKRKCWLSTHLSALSQATSRELVAINYPQLSLKYWKITSVHAEEADCNRSAQSVSDVGGNSDNYSAV